MENVNRGGRGKGQSSEYAISPALLDFFPFILFVQFLTHSNSTQFPRSGLDRSKIERIKRDIIGRVEETAESGAFSAMPKPWKDRLHTSFPVVRKLVVPRKVPKVYSESLTMHDEKNWLNRCTSLTVVAEKCNGTKY